MMIGVVADSPIALGCVGALLFAVVAISILIFRVIFPTIITHPWSIPPKDSRQSKLDKRATVVLAGSFNPPHWGHLVMIRYLADRYGKVICCIGVNPNKQYDITPQSRAEILREMLKTDDGVCKNVTVEVVSGYIWRFARAQNATLFFRGIRTWSVDGHEERNLQILNTWGPLLLGWIWPIKTIFLEGDPRYREVSSTLVRQLCARRRDRTESKGNDADDDELTRLVPERVASKVAEVYGANS